jgi:hypothetical protein
MQENIYHLHIKKQYVTALIEDLIKVNAVEIIHEAEAVELTEQQKAALDKELTNISSNSDYLLKWNDTKNRFKKP